MTLKLSHTPGKLVSMKNRSLTSVRATWRQHFLAIARETQVAEAGPFRIARAGLRTRALSAFPSLSARIRIPASAAA